MILPDHVFGGVIHLKNSLVYRIGDQDIAIGQQNQHPLYWLHKTVVPRDTPQTTSA